MIGVLLANAAATLMMTGLVWFVQAVHYPLFPCVEASSFAAYQAANIRRTTRVVAAPMLVEALSTAWLVWERPAGVSSGQAWLGLALVALVWASTATIQLPRHRALAKGYDLDVHRSLVAGNWIRTVAWTLRAGLVLLMLWGTMQGGEPAAAHLRIF